jgi:hypothetical protein
MAVLGLEPRAYTLSGVASPFFVMGVFKIESLELRSSISLPPEQLGLQA